MVQLAGAPAGVAEREQALARAAAAGDRLQDVEARGQRQARRRRQAAVAGPVGGVQHEAAAVIDRAALAQPDLARRRRRLDIELLQQRLEAGPGRAGG